ncbi:MAG: twin-arginine translocase subunit TatC [Candidatus Omnitrophica bacterium]|nr:twin-arginine translocase subunit TatC [Candidatus Omnitrophota bacterium]
MNEKTLSLVTHLEEFRRRIIYCLVAISAAGIFSYLYKEQILLLLIKPVEQVFFLTLPEALLAYLKISIVSGIILASPYIIYQIWAFTWSAFRPIEKRYIIIYGILSFLLFIAGVLFGYIVGLPAVIRFLLSFARDYLTPMISINKYINFCFIVIILSGLLFEFPLIIVFITSAGLVTIEKIAAKRKYIIVGIFAIATVLTPPDVVTQLFTAIPLYLLFEISILISRLVRVLKVRRA